MSDLFPIGFVFLAAPVAFAISYGLVILLKTRESGARHRKRYERLQLEALYGDVGYRAR